MPSHAAETIKRRENTLRKFLEKHDVPSWFRSMSESQIKATTDLLNAIRDDGEQGTYYRVRSCLMRIGIDPIISPKELHLIINLSRGSDIAFMYFLWQGFYKSEDQRYNGNEQLIMTTIMYLDLQFTVRELDHILPAAQPKQKVLRKPTKKVNCKKIYRMELAKREVELSNYTRDHKSKFAPYFQKQIRPSDKHTRFRCVKPVYRVSFPFWKVGEEPKYKINNEKRWFADYELQPTLRLVKQMISSVVDKLTDNISRTTLQDANITDLDNEKNLCEYHKFLKNEAEVTKDRLKYLAKQRCLEMINVTAHANKLREERIRQQLEADIDWYTAKYKKVIKLQYTHIKTINQEECVICKHFVATPIEENEMKFLIWHNDIGRLKTAATNNIATIIEGPNPIFKQRNINFNEIAANCRPVELKINPFALLESQPRVPLDNTMQKQLMDLLFQQTTKGFQLNTNQLQLLQQLHINAAEAKPLTLEQQEQLLLLLHYLEHEHALLERDVCDPANAVELQNKDYPYADLYMTTKNAPKSNPYINELRKNVFCKLEIVSGEHIKTKTDQETNNNKSELKFFTTCTTHAPYKFNYKHIFQQDGKIKNKKYAKIIEKACVKALTNTDNINAKNDVMSHAPSADSCFIEMSKSGTTSIKSNTKSQASQEQNKHAYKKKRIVNAILECAKTIWKKKLKEHNRKMAIIESKAKKYSVLQARYENVEYFDPENEQFMNTLLREGMTELAKDHRFVFASFPESHKLPLLREWIKRRFGKTYTQDELTKSFDDSLNIFHTVMSLQVNAPKVMLYGMPTDPVSYFKHDEMFKLASKIRENYYKKLNDKLMQHSTYSWFAMGHYMCQKGSPKALFYSYMPANKNNILRINPWNGEHRDYKLLRRKFS